MKRAIVVVIGMVMVWLGLGGPATAAVDVSPVAVATYTYDAPADTASTSTTTTEHGPPAPRDYSTTCDPDGLRPLGPLARQEGSSLRVTYGYGHTVPLVWAEPVSRSVKEQADGAKAGSVFVQRLRVAANTGSRLSEASAAAFRASENPSSIFIKNKHLASSGIRGGNCGDTGPQV